MTSGERPFPIPATVENVAAAKAFVVERWRERAAETGREAPLDLSGSCKFASAFAAAVFGGEVEGNLFHQWIRLSEGRILDLNEDAGDVRDYRRGVVPTDVAAYAAASRAVLPKDVYAHDPVHMARRDTRASLASCRPRVLSWIAAYADLLGRDVEVAGPRP